MMRSTSSSWMMTGPMSPMRRQRRKTNLKSRQQTRSGLRSGVGVGASKLEELMSRQLEEAGIEFEREQMLIPGRKFRFDFVLPQSCLIVECEGGTWSGGRHTSGVGFRNDCVKYNLAVEHGYVVLRYTSDLIKNGSAIESIARVHERYAVQTPLEAI